MTNINCIVKPKNKRVLKDSRAEGRYTARIATKTKRCQHISCICTYVTKRIEFKIITTTYKALNGMAPSYIYDLQVHQPNRNLRSASRGLSLVVPPHQTQAYGARSLSVAAPTLWNSLPVDIKNAQSLFTFKKKLKTFLFNQLHS